MGVNDINSLAHTKWNCKYHIVFAPKYRRKVFYQEKREAVGKILRQLCERATSNSPTQLTDRTYAFDACARNIGLRPHKQNHPLGGWMLIVCCRSVGERVRRINAAAAAMRVASPELAEWDDGTIYQLLEKVTVLEGFEIRVTFRNGQEVEQIIDQPKRRKRESQS